MRRLVDSLPKGVRKALKAVPGSRALSNRLFASPRGDRIPSGQMRPVIYLPTWLEWGYMKQRPQYILEALARLGHQVWFVSSAVDKPVDVGPSIRVVPSLRPVPRSGVLIYTHFAPTRSMADRFDDAVVIYDLLDDLSIYDEDEEGLPESQRVRAHHDSFIDRADIVIASNPLLIKRHRRERNDILLLENGVDSALFNPTDPAAPVGDGTIVGYHGAISSWFDFGLVGEVVSRRPDLTFVFVGPIDERVSVEAGILGDYNNVILLPARPAAEVAAAVRSFEVGWIPFVVDEMTAGVTPLKMFEYLASCVPVVATPLPACESHPGVQTASTAAEMVAALEAGLALGSGERSSLRPYGEEAAWAARVAPLITALDEMGLRLV